ncbi:MAG: hypothetical protein FD134_2446 [Gallionellaceae bacterium]|nr:MAG: hypothetical protein FD134_2446 [Gallionellaceae bacterium]
MGALWMLVAGFLFGCMGVFVKLGAQYFSPNELVFYRSFVGLLMIYAVVRHRGLSLATRHWQPHLWRSVSGTIAMMLFFYCITVLPLATAVTLNYTSPLFLLLGLVSGMLAGVAMLNVRQLGLHGEPDWRVVFYFSLVSSLASGAAMLFDTVHPVSASSLLILIGLGGSATLAQLAMTRAYRTGKTLVVGSLSFSTVLFSGLFGAIFWGEALTLAGWAGMALIVASGVLSLRLAPHHPEE